jgi:hypothetical protein
MAYLKPPAFTRKVFNPLAMKFGIGNAVTLAVPGRGTGAEQQIPVIPVEIDGARYVVSTRGDSEWVRNARAAGALELRTKDGAQRYSITEVPVTERPAIIDAYRKLAGKTVDGYWKKLPEPADHPTFRLQPA